MSNYPMAASMARLGKPEVVFPNLDGPGGNVFNLIAICKRALKEEHLEAYNEMWGRIQISRSYEEARKVMAEYVTIIQT